MRRLAGRASARCGRLRGRWPRHDRLLAPEACDSEIAATAPQRPAAGGQPLVPFARRAHVEAASEADVVVTFWGSPAPDFASLDPPVGSVEEALAARRAGADAVIAQGSEAGGHVRGTLPATSLLARVRDAVPDDYPVLVGRRRSPTRPTPRARPRRGAEAVVAATAPDDQDESAPPRLRPGSVEARETLLTERVAPAARAAPRIANEATARSAEARSVEDPAGRSGSTRSRRSACSSGVVAEQLAVRGDAEADRPICRRRQPRRPVTRRPGRCATSGTPGVRRADRRLRHRERRSSSTAA